jgi:predicted lactoylglutathione lyase
MITQPFISIPVKDLNRSIEFFTKLGFEDLEGHLWEVFHMDIEK